MYCLSCKDRKLSEDFPAKVSDLCNHVAKICLQCLEKKCGATADENTPSCPQCGAKITSSRRQDIKAQLSFLQCKVLQDLAKQSTVPENFDSIDQPMSGSITIAQLDGRSFELQITRNTSFHELRTQIARSSGVAPHDQRLMYNGRRLVLDAEAGGRWSDLKISFGSLLHLIVVMLSVTGSKVEGGFLQFSLTWTPTLRTDVKQNKGTKIKQLNGICSIHSHTGQEIDIIHFDNRASIDGAIIHSGSSGAGNPRQVISVSLPEVSANAHYLIFTLCSRFGLEAIVDPRVALSGATGQTYASYSPNLSSSATCDRHHEGAGGAVVLCAAVRDSVHGFTILRCGSQCLGYVVGHCKRVERAKYAPIGAEINRLMRGPLQVEGSVQEDPHEPGVGLYNPLRHRSTARASGPSGREWLDSPSPLPTGREWLEAGRQTHASRAPVSSGPILVDAVHASGAVYPPHAHSSTRMDSSEERSQPIEPTPVTINAPASREGEVEDMGVATSADNNGSLTDCGGLSLLEHVLLGPLSLPSDRHMLGFSSKYSTGTSSIQSQHGNVDAHVSPTSTHGVSSDHTNLENSHAQMENGMVQQCKVPPAISQRLRCLSPRRHTLAELVVKELCAVKPARAMSLIDINSSQIVDSPLLMIAAAAPVDIGISPSGTFQRRFFELLPDIFSVSSHGFGLRIQLSADTAKGNQGNDNVFQ